MLLRQGHSTFEKSDKKYIGNKTNYYYYSLFQKPWLKHKVTASTVKTIV